MRPLRTTLIFLSGVAVYATMAACSGDEETASSSPSGSSGSTSGVAGHPGVGGNGGTAYGGNGGTASGGGPGSGGTSSSGSGAGASGGAGGAGGSGGFGGGGLRLFRVFGSGSDGTSDPSITIAPSSQANLLIDNGLRPERVLWDNHRQEECNYYTAADGRFRCLPIDVAGLVYTDAACTHAAIDIAAPAPGCPLHVPKYARRGDNPPVCGGSGGGTVHIYSVGAFLGADLPCYLYGGNACDLASCGPGAFYAVGTEIPASEFVAGTLTHD